MHITDRFAKLWVNWDATVQSRADIPDVLRSAKDEDLIELLAGASAQDRKYERDVVATEILNRLHRRHSDLPAAAAEVLRSAEAAYEAAAQGQQAIHTAEGILKAEGKAALGAEVSASAYTSLDTTKLAFEAAKQNISDVQASVSRSRIANRLAEDAVNVAEKTSDATRKASRPLEDAGHPVQAKAACDAADDMTEKAQATLAATRGDGDAEDDEDSR